MAVLLLVTVGYCILLERRIRSFKMDHEGLRSLVGDLDKAIQRAQACVIGLGKTTKATERALDGRLVEARALAKTLALASAPPRRAAGASQPVRRAKTEGANP
ncbi:MAG: DUF6468 domain-containing protein [Alphaproteobacteria bacterium]